MTISNNLSEDKTKDFKPFMDKLKEVFNRNVGDNKLFTVNFDKDIFQEYLNSFSEDHRQEFNCSCCKYFLRNYGGLVTINEEGLISSPLWDTTEDFGFFNNTVKVMSKFVKKSKVKGVFLTDKKVLGTDYQGGWYHFCVETPDQSYFKNYIKEPNQQIAEKYEDFKIVSRGLTVYKEQVVDQALKLLDTDSLYRSEKVIGPVKWLKDLHVALKHSKNKQNTIWKFVADAPVGFCHVTSNMASTLMDDIAEGMSFDLIKRRFEQKMAPYNYLRPKAAPSKQNIEQAEAIVEKLGIKDSLKRRYAKLEDLETLWVPVNKQDVGYSQDSVFGHLKAKDETTIRDVSTNAVNITWSKFKRKVLPNIDSMEILIPYHGNFCAYLTAEDEDALNILQWDNTVSMYVYSRGSAASQWNLNSGEYVKVNALSYRPSMWGDNIAPNQQEGVLFIVDGCRDKESPGLALFPEILKSELHGVRSTIEAFSNNGKASGLCEATACGLFFSDNNSVTVKVISEGLTSKYTIDRWE